MPIPVALLKKWLEEKDVPEETQIQILGRAMLRADYEYILHGSHFPELFDDQFGRLWAMMFTDEEIQRIGFENPELLEPLREKSRRDGGIPFKEPDKPSNSRHRGSLIID